jgi:dCMP deaminase
MKLAELVAGWSKDPSTKVACVLVKERRIISTGFNGFPKGINDDINRLMNREEKYELTIHAETNAIITAAIHGVSTNGCSAYITMHPCSRCAAALINAGIKNVYVKSWDTVPSRWIENFILSSKLLEEAGVPLVSIDP